LLVFLPAKIEVHNIFNLTFGGSKAMKILNLLAVLILFAAVSTSFGQNIAGSAHDFSGNGWSNGEICLPCHTPHNADISVANSPLWNHEVTVATYTLYTSNTFDATMGQPGESSKLCLSCHDGTVALDSFGGSTGSTMLTGDGNLGTDLADDHPISFVYDAALATADGELENPSTNTTVAGLLFGGQLQCASCHDVHNSLGQANLLVLDNAASALCLTCHIK
jgi:predicted CXXCH cytochrome family protein